MEQEKTILLSIGLTALTILTFAIPKFYAGFRVSRTTFISAWLGWFICLSFHTILPIDVYIANKHPKNSNNLKMVWRAIYWIMVFLTCIYLPILRFFYLSGDFGFKKKLKSAIKLILFWDVLGLIIGGLYAFYAFKNHKLSSL